MIGQQVIIQASYTIANLVVYGYTLMASVYVDHSGFALVVYVN